MPALCLEGRKVGSGKELPWTTGVGSGWSAPLASAPGKGARPLGAPLRGFEGRLTAGPSQLQPHTFLATWAHIPAGWGRGASLSQPSAGDPGLCPALAAYWRLSVGKSVLARGPHRPATHKSAPTIRLPSPPLATLPSRALPPRRPGLGAQTPEVMTDSERCRLRAHRGSGRVPRTLLPNSLLSLDEKFAGASAAPSRGRVVVETEVADIPAPSRTVSAKDGLRQGVACASAEPCGPPGTRPPVLHPGRWSRRDSCRVGEKCARAAPSHKGGGRGPDGDFARPWAPKVRAGLAGAALLLLQKEPDFCSPLSRPSRGPESDAAVQSAGLALKEGSCGRGFVCDRGCRQPGLCTERQLGQCGWTGVPGLGAWSRMGHSWVSASSRKGKAGCFMLELGGGGSVVPKGWPPSGHGAEAVVVLWDASECTGQCGRAGVSELGH
ncbi:uncharacterized protein [Manis javanica]|uniref:uncharacterized protein n=1 Tax=Manis javanica TaxID=9974 RepID=UPI003C6CE545